MDSYLRVNYEKNADAKIAIIPISEYIQNNVVAHHSVRVLIT
jgi:hypothetical protein